MARVDIFMIIIVVDKICLWWWHLRFGVVSASRSDARLTGGGVSNYRRIESKQTNIMCDQNYSFWGEAFENYMRDSFRRIGIYDDYCLFSKTRLYLSSSILVVS